MELNIGMTTKGLIAFANEILAKSLQAEGEGGSVEVVRYVQPNGVGNELMLNINNDDMQDREDLSEDAAFYEID